MFTRCPACSTVHPVNAALLARDAGRYRCGKCQAKNNALDALFDDWPEAGQKPAPKGESPVLGAAVDLDEASRARQAPEGAGLTGEPPADERPPRRARLWLLRTAWMVAGLVVGAVIIFKAAEWSGHPVVQPHEIDAWKTRLGLSEAKTRTPFRALDRIHLVSRQLTADPSQPGVLRLEATIVNRASQPQPYPKIEVVLFDASGARLSDFEFEPEAYLAPGADTRASMSPHAYLPLSLQLEDPGEQAVGFELDFR